MDRTRESHFRIAIQKKVLQKRLYTIICEYRYDLPSTYTRNKMKILSSTSCLASDLRKLEDFMSETPFMVGKDQKKKKVKSKGWTAWQSNLVAVDFEIFAESSPFSF